MGSVETVLGDVSQYSTVNNNVWRSLTVELGFNVSRSGRVRRFPLEKFPSKLLLKLLFLSFVPVYLI